MLPDRKPRKAWSLVELLVSLAIIAVLLALFVPAAFMVLRAALRLGK
jgi:prepilin-type N-terminal cleavage/methylation domain-containing protein